MGFWDGLSRLVQGKPAFVVPGDEQSRPVQSTGFTQRPETATAVDEAGYKIIPELAFEHCTSHVNGSSMDVTVWATNQSNVQIELDKIVMLGLTTELDRFLSPGEAHELKLFSGKVPTNDNYHTASLYYKQVSSGDYFCANFRIEYDYDSEGYYTVSELHPIHPIKDV